MENVTFNGLSIEQFFDGSARRNPVKIIIEDVFLLSEKEANNLADVIIQLHKVGCESKTMKPIFSNPILKRREDKGQDTVPYLQKDYSQ